MKRLLSLFLGIPFFIFSNPSSPTVISGSATFSNSGNTYTITSTADRTVVDWESFSIGDQEVTVVNQPSCTSVILLRVTGDNASDIIGYLKSNGTVFLLNSNGITIAASSRVEMGGLVASTLEIQNAEFIAGGDILFSGVSTQLIQNFGIIIVEKSGAFLLGRYIVNQNDILAASTKAVFGAGNSILFQTSQDNITVNPDGGGVANGTGIINSGDILCSQAIFQADGNLYTLGIQQQGTINALATAPLNGEIHFLTQNGVTTIENEATLSTKGMNDAGGAIHILGQTVNLLGTASLFTRNERGGGTILIGGNFGGGDPNILDATNTTIEPDVKIDSSARLTGNAGGVSIFALDTATFQGSIVATGGIFNGNGGTVELSALNLNNTGTVDTEAYDGTNGQLIIDPPDIHISEKDDPSSISYHRLNASLQKNDVILKATAISEETGNIIIDNPIMFKFDTNHTLTLMAERDIIIKSPFFSEDFDRETSKIKLNAGRHIIKNY